MVPHDVTALPSLPSGWQAIRHAVLADATLAVVVTDVDLVGACARIRAGEGQFAPANRLAQCVAQGHACILTLSSGDWQGGPVIPLESPYLIPARFADGRWLVAGARTDGQNNARILSSDGRLLSRLMLGDGIENIAVDALDRIWVGWFDEGIFGNGNWQFRDRVSPPLGERCRLFRPERCLDRPAGLARWHGTGIRLL